MINVFCEIQDGDADEEEEGNAGPLGSVNNVKRREFVPLVKDAS